jgi:predicted nucleic acid-binding protein
MMNSTTSHFGGGRRSPGTTVVTYDGIVVEVLAHVSGMGAHVRRRAVELVDRLRSDPYVMLIEQTRDLLDAGLDLYGRRSDKAYSLTDAMSMVICQRLGITQVLSHDHHFEQEGLQLLL